MPAPPRPALHLHPSPTRNRNTTILATLLNVGVCIYYLACSVVLLVEALLNVLALLVVPAGLVIKNKLTPSPRSSPAGLVIKNKLTPSPKPSTALCLSVSGEVKTFGIAPGVAGPHGGGGDAATDSTGLTPDLTPDSLPGLELTVTSATPDTADVTPITLLETTATLDAIRDATRDPTLDVTADDALSSTIPLEADCNSSPSSNFGNFTGRLSTKLSPVADALLDLVRSPFYRSKEDEGNENLKPDSIPIGPYTPPRSLRESPI